MSETAEHPWYAHYPAGVPHDVDTSGYGSLIDLIEESFAKFADRNAYAGFGKALTYGRLDTLSRQLGAYLQSLGLAQGDRVAIMMPNVLQYPVAVAAVLRAGFVAVNVNPLYTPRELEHQLADSGARAIIILENFASTLQQARAKTRIEKDGSGLLAARRRGLQNGAGARREDALSPRDAGANRCRGAAIYRRHDRPF